MEQRGWGIWDAWLLSVVLVGVGKYGSGLVDKCFFCGFLPLVSARVMENMKCVYLSVMCNLGSSSHGLVVVLMVQF